MPRSTFRTRLLSATALACGTISIAGNVRAQCLPDPVGSAAKVTCTGSDPNGFAAPGPNDLLVAVGTGASIGSIPGQSPSAAITFNLNTGLKELTIASGSSLYGGAVRSDSNSGSIGVWNLNPNLFAGVALGAVGDTGTIRVHNLPGGSLGPSTLTGDGGNLFDNAGATSGAVSLAGNGRNEVVNRVGASTSGLVTLTGDGENIFDDSGDMSSGLKIVGSGTNQVTNRAGATIRSTFAIQGDGTNDVWNWGTLTNGFTSTGTAVDYFENQGSISGNVSLGGGSDDFRMVTGNMTNNASWATGTTTRSSPAATSRTRSPAGRARTSSTGPAARSARSSWGRARISPR